MKLQRHDARADYGGGTYPVEDDDGEYYLAEDVDALLASIRAAVDAERECVCCEQSLSLSAPDHEVAETCQKTDDARAALDALLGGAEVDR